MVTVWSTVCRFLPALWAGEGNGEAVTLEEVTLSSVGWPWPTWHRTGMAGSSFVPITH